MNKITQINITNYRAFYNENNKNNEPEPYNIDLPSGQNLLVYGENGSGKSSFFHALADFFASASNQQLAIEENIFTAGKTDLPSAQIEVHFSEKNGNEWLAPVAFVFSANSNTFEEKFLTKSTQIFLTYRDMLKTYFLDIDDKDNSPNLFGLFIDNLLSKITETAQNEEIKAKLDDIQNQIEQLPQAIKDAIENAIEERAKEEDIMEEEDKAELIQTLKAPIQEEITDFNQSLTTILGDSIAEVNTYLSDNYFKTHFTISLKNTDQYLTLNDDKLSKTLYFKIKYFGKDLEDKRYQIFLNEARLSALAICLYLVAVKKDRPSLDNYKILFLDDIFIGLDTSNRLPLLRILSEDFSDYQIFMTTYDRHWFEIAKHYLPENKWQSMEMYVGENAQHNFEFPIIISPSHTHYQKAEKYTNRKKHVRNSDIDYPAAGNYLRKEVEKFLKHYLFGKYRFIENDKGETLLRSELQQLWDMFSKQIQDMGFSMDNFLNFSQLSKSVFNPFSHDNLDKPIYKTEIDAAFTFVDELHKLSKKTLFEKGATIYLRANYEETVRTFEIKVNAPIFLFEQNDNRWSNIELASFSCKKYEENGTQTNFPKIEGTLSKLYDNAYHGISSGSLKNASSGRNIKTEFTNINGKTVQELMAEL